MPTPSLSPNRREPDRDRDSRSKKRLPGRCVRQLFVGIVAAACVITSVSAAAPDPRAAAARDSAIHSRAADASQLLARVAWLRSSHEYGSPSLLIRGTPVIYVDPAHLAALTTRPKADLILLTHPHPDHLDLATLATLHQPGTTIVTVRDVARELPVEWARVIVLAPGEGTTIGCVAIQAVPAYNSPGGMHPRAAGWAGYVLSIDGAQLYVSGDTSLTPEMSALPDIDAAVFNLRAPYQMSSAEIIEASRAMKPRFVIPIHWTASDRDEIDALPASFAPGTQRVLLEPQ